MITNTERGPATAMTSVWVSQRPVDSELYLSLSVISG